MPLCATVLLNVRNRKFLREVRVTCGAGGRCLNGKGYISLGCCRNHPKADKKGRILEHIVVMEKKIGRYLKDGETVHHKNGLRWDNRPENLELWVSNHHPGQRVADLIDFIAEYYSAEILLRLKATVINLPTSETSTSPKPNNLVSVIEKEHGGELCQNVVLQDYPLDYVI